jgi:hypothetical protein
MRLFRHGVLRSFSDRMAGAASRAGRVVVCAADRPSNGGRRLNAPGAARSHAHRRSY